MIYECVVSLGQETAVVPVEAEDLDMAEDEAVEVVENVLMDNDLEDLVDAGDGPERTLWFGYPLDDVDGYDEEFESDGPTVVSVREITSAQDTHFNELTPHYEHLLARAAA